MVDMARAGINPVLAARFDASTPPGAMAQMPNVGLSATQGSAQTVTSALAIRRQQQELKNLAAQEQLTKAQAGLAGENIRVAQIQQRLMGYQADVRESASLFIQSALSFIPPELRNNPAGARAWFLQKAQTYAREHAQGITRIKKLIGDMLNIFESMLDFGTDLIDATPTPDARLKNLPKDGTYRFAPNNNRIIERWDQKRKRWFTWKSYSEYMRTKS